MAIPMRDVPTHDRPRERLIQLGPGALSDAELVAVQLGSGHAGANAIDVARDLLATLGGVGGLAKARPAELARFPGLGPAKAARLVAAFGIASRVNDTRESRPRLQRSVDIAQTAIPLIATAQVEQVLVLVADGRLRLRRTETVAVGSAGACPVPVREIVAAVLRHDGVAFAVTHNHPSGDPSPSTADLAATGALRDAARATGLRFLDHVVVAGIDWRSASG